MTLNGVLTQRQHDVLELAAQGLTIQQIADTLFLSRETVKTHLLRACNVLGANGRSQAISLMWEFKLWRNQPDTTIQKTGILRFDSRLDSIAGRFGESKTTPTTLQISSVDGKKATLIVRGVEPKALQETLHGYSPNTMVMLTLSVRENSPNLK
jgi:DNA-binding CsgD family transcriptional regulator